MRFVWERSMERALKETKSNGFYGRRLPGSAVRSDRAVCSSSRRFRKATRSRTLHATSTQFSKERSCTKIKLRLIAAANRKYLSKRVFPPVFKALCIRMICFYQKYLSRHTCLYSPTCSEYTKRCINNLGVIPGIILGMWRILRCNPLSKGGIDPAPENPFKKKWLL